MTTREILKSDKLPAPAAPYSVATRWGDLLFISGQVPGDVSQDIAGQTEQVMEKLKAIMAESWHRLRAGAQSHLLPDQHCRLSTIQRGLQTLRRGWKPARSTIEAKLAGQGMKVEVDMIVGIPS